MFSIFNVNPGFWQIIYGREVGQRTKEYSTRVFDRSRQKKLHHMDFDGIDSSLGNVLSLKFTFQDVKLCKIWAVCAPLCRKRIGQNTFTQSCSGPKFDVSGEKSHG